MLTEANIQQYRQEGYTICKELLSRNELDEMTIHVDRYVEEPETKMLREGSLSKWFATHPLYLVRGKDERGTNSYVNV